MAEKLRERIRHLVPAFLLSAGLALPFAGSLDETLVSPRMLYIIAGVLLLFEAASLHRAAAWAAAITAAAGAAVWLTAGNGAQALSDAGIAVSLRLKGLRTAIPLAAEPLSVLIAAVMTLLCCFATLRRATCIPALMLCTAVMMVVWITDSMQMLPWLLSALAVVLALLLTYRDEDTPVLRVLPWSAVLVLLAFLLTGIAPKENPVKEKADEIRQAILDRLFFTEARDVFSLYAAGLSPQGADQLGGKPNPSDSAVMQVSTPQLTYLRGTVYNHYTGHGWLNTTGGRRYLWQSRRMAETRAALFDEGLPPESAPNLLTWHPPRTVSVRMLTGSASTLFVPQRIRELNPGGETVPYFSNSSEVFITRNLQAGDTWEVSAPLYLSTDPDMGMLTEACAAQNDPQWESIRNTYTELPGHLEQPVFDLAAEVTSGAYTPYEKAMALQNYLTRHYRYTLDVPDHPENVDFVTSFLLDTREGYCTYFASAMTVLCRMVGLPARYVEGYLAEPNENGEALVTGMNAHAWTEVYFRGFGWLTFDATPRRSASGQQGGGQNPPSSTPQPTETPTPEPTATPTPGPADPEHPEEPGGEAETPKPPEGGEPSVPPPDTPPEPPDGPSAPPEEKPEPPEGNADREVPPFPWWILLILLAAAAAAFRVWTASPGYREKRARTEEERFSVWADEIRKLLKAEQIVRRNGETPIAFARRVDSTGIFSESLLPAGECLSAVRYSRAEASEADTELMRDTARLLRSELSRPGKMRCLRQRLLSKK